MRRASRASTVLLTPPHITGPLSCDTKVPYRHKNQCYIDWFALKPFINKLNLKCNDVTLKKKKVFGTGQKQHVLRDDANEMNIYKLTRQKGKKNKNNREPMGKSQLLWRPVTIMKRCRLFLRPPPPKKTSDWSIYFSPPNSGKVHKIKTIVLFIDANTNEVYLCIVTWHVSNLRLCTCRGSWILIFILL